MKTKQKIFIFMLVFIFVLLAFLINNNVLVQFDEWVYRLLIAFESNTLTAVFKYISHLVHIFMIIVILFILFFINRKLSFFTLGYVLINSVLAQIFKFIFVRERPIINQLISIDGYSFPSAHAMMAMALYGFLIWCVWQSALHKYTKGILTFILAFVIIAIGCSRIYLGVHYASDVLAGYLISFLYLYIVTLFFYKTPSFKK